jgi:glyoxylase-like metal-dependent hydrolase (beta-lactamase superfamily II)
VIEEVTPSVHHLPEIVGGPTLILGDNSVTLVDTGVPGADVEIVEALESLGRSSDDVKRILITHADGDHVGGLAALADATGARVYASEHEAKVIEGQAPSRRGETHVWGRVDECVTPGDALPFHGGIDVIDTAGHTLGHVAYFLRSDGVLFSGDCVNNRGGLSGSPPELTADEEQARAAVQTIAALRPRSVCFGHGPSLIGDAAAQLDELATRVS